MIYSWKPTARIKADAQKTGEMCRELENTVGLTPKTLLEANREEGTLLHDEFEWNNDIAAEAYRETQARYIIRNLCATVEPSEKTPARAFFPIVCESSTTKNYESIDVILKSEDKSKELFNNAMKELNAFKAKYKQLTELQSVFEAIDQIEIMEEQG